MGLAEDLEIIENCILQGNMAEAKRLIKSMYKRKKLPINRLAKFGNLANRCGEFSLTMMALFEASEEYGEDPFVIQEYVTALFFLGCRQRAFKLTQDLVDKNHPGSDFLMAIGNLKNWDFKKSSEFWLRHLDNTHLDQYQILVAKINLAFCFNEAGQAKESLQLCNELIADSFCQNSKRVFLNAQQIRCQALIQLNDYDQAFKSLNNLEAELRFFSSEEKNSFHRWKSICQYRLGGDKETLFSSLQTLYDDSLKNKQYELARACHFHIGDLLDDHIILQENYIGTPFSEYQDKLLKKHPFLKEVSSFNKCYHAGKENFSKNNNLRFLDLESGQLDDLDFIEPGSVPHKVIKSLYSDFYRPLSVYEVFELVFPDEVFNPDSGFTKIRSNIYRLNNILKSQNLGLEIHSRKKTFYLLGEGPVEVKCKIHYKEIIAEKEWGQLIELFPEGNFKSKEMREKLEIGEKKGAKILQRFLDEGKLDKLGNGPNTRYRIKKAG